MANANLAYRPQVILARRVKEARELKRWTQQQLVDKLEEIGYTMQQSGLARLEGGKRSVSVDELFALAAALETSPLYLLTPLDDGEPVSVTPRVQIPARGARAWLRGYPVPMGPDLDLAQLPESELLQRVRAHLERNADPSVAWMSSFRQSLDDLAREIVDQIRNPEREEAPLG